MADDNKIVPSPTNGFPTTLEEIETFLLKKEASWRETRLREYDDFVELIRVGRALAVGIKAVLVMVEKLEEMQADRLEELENRMVNHDTVRFMVNGLRADIADEQKKLEGE
jgi:hypothetical protein